MRSVVSTLPWILAVAATGATATSADPPRFAIDGFHVEPAAAHGRFDVRGDAVLRPAPAPAATRYAIASIDATCAVIDPIFKDGFE